MQNASFKRISELFKAHPGCKPSDLVEQKNVDELYDIVKSHVSKKVPYKPNLLINGTFNYPKKLKDAKEPVEILYYSGNLDHLSTPAIAIVGTRKPTKEGEIRAARITKFLTGEGFTIVSGLAAGIDTIAHETAINNNGKTIAVLGTPINEYYPKQNIELQNYIAKNHLLVSQVPFYRYSQQTPYWNKLFFPERNKTMSALTLGTVITEASETSGTLIQARAAIDQGRKLFILDSCFDNAAITWPHKFLKLGAFRVKSFEDIISKL